MGHGAERVRAGRVLSRVRARSPVLTRCGAAAPPAPARQGSDADELASATHVPARPSPPGLVAVAGLADAPSAPARATSGRGAGYRTQGARPRTAAVNRCGGQQPGVVVEIDGGLASQRRCGFPHVQFVGQLPTPEELGRNRQSK